MTIEEVRKYYTNGYLFKKRTGMAADSFYSWMEKGYVPINSQKKLEKLTDGALRADINHIP